MASMQDDYARKLRHQQPARVDYSRPGFVRPETECREFRERVDDMSMCVCGMPALGHPDCHPEEAS